MGYDIHITRQENWFDDDDSRRISIDEWKNLVAGDIEMSMDNLWRFIIKSESDEVQIIAKQLLTDLNQFTANRITHSNPVIRKQ